ncbi:hypothetical protein C5S29_02285 [ANME-1 cluster archaeon GoMg3.2]|nr:hypothetical protein [ANME-1 cluster archaeon GoMg3.2]
MKKQIVVILAIIAVITTLFTVSALSNEVGYKLSLCDAIDISIGNATVTDFLNGTDKATVQVYNSKRYEGDNIRMVQWSSSDSSLDVYVNVTAGNISRIEEKIVPTSLLYHEEIIRSVISDGECIYRLYNPITDAYSDRVVAIAACPTSWSILTDKEDNFCELEDTTFDWFAYMAYHVQTDDTTKSEYPWFPYP